MLPIHNNSQLSKAISKSHKDTHISLYFWGILETAGMYLHTF